MMMTSDRMEIPQVFQEATTTKASMTACKNVLQQYGLTHSFRRRADMDGFFDRLRWPYEMPWRDEQRECLERFGDPGWDELIVQAIFGGGKTTMMLAMVQHLVLTGMLQGEGIQVCAFNVCIKNEVKKKLRFLGKKFRIQTFDSIIYGLCDELGYDNLRALDFDGKRKYVRQHLSRVEPLEEVAYLFVDEAQDLEKHAYDIFRKRFPRARRIFVGDVFQSIQKEPRESMLWYMLRRAEDPRVIRYSMTDTPRVPRSVLDEVKGALQEYYPEFSSTIEKWTSSSLMTAHVPISWHAFDSYKQVYEDMLAFIREKGPENVMVLTFSSAITVRGVLGDVSRVRQFLTQSGVPVNSNHKRMKDDRLFLSTANSSKGLERDHVFGFLTFPLELAFANFSDDLVVNLTTVALSRCKKSVSMYVPRFKDRFSKVLTLYRSCPAPVVKPVPATGGKRAKTCTDAVFDDRHGNKREMLEKEHSITEALRLSILSFSTRTLLKSYAKRYQATAIPQENMHRIPVSEEDSTFCGIVFETLTLCAWKNKWPHNASTDGTFAHHDIFQAFQSRILAMRNEFMTFCRRHPVPSTLNPQQLVQGACLYGKLHLACFQKVFWKHGPDLIDRITRHWCRIRGVIVSLQPSHAQLETLRVQHNLAMPFLNGIADAVLLPPKGSAALLEVFEIKASKSSDWQENAFLQSILYGICLGKTLFRLHLVNVFSKESYSYSVNLGKDFFMVRDAVVADVQQWNLNCFLSKNVTHHDPQKKTLHIQGTFFIDGRLGGTGTTDKNRYFLSEVVSPTKTCMHPLTNLEEELPQKIKDFEIRKIIVGRHLPLAHLESLFPDHKALFKPLRWAASKKETRNDASKWQVYLRSMGWFESSSSVEATGGTTEPAQGDKDSKSYLEWDNPQSTFMVQWAHLCTMYNMGT